MASTDGGSTGGGGEPIYGIEDGLANPGGGGGNFVAGGGGKVEGSQLNTNTGNQFTRVPIVAWKSRGQSGVNLTLYHNSVQPHAGDFGENWSFSYDASIAYSGTTAIYHRADGLLLPYTEDLYGDFATPPGFYNTLVHNTGGTWTLTEKDGTKKDFDSAGYLTKLTDRNGNYTTVSRNTSHQVTDVTDYSTSARTLHFTYGSNGRVDTVTDPMSREWGFNYDSNHNLTSIDYPLLSSTPHARSFTYDSDHCILTHEDLEGQTWTYTFDTNHRLKSAEDPTNLEWDFNYHGSDTEMILPDGTNKVIDYYSGGLLTSRKDPTLESVNIYSRDTAGNITELHDKRGKAWKYTYDGKGNVLTAKDPYNNTTTYTYNSAFSEPLTILDANTNKTYLTYDTHGNLLTVKDDLCTSWYYATYAYDSGGHGERISSTDATGVVTSCTHDTNGDVNQSTDAAGIPTAYAYDTLGRLHTATDNLSHVETIDRDEWERPVTVTHGVDSTHVDMTYDLESRILTGADENGHPGTITYDDAGRVLTSKNALNETITDTYDTNGWLETITDGNGSGHVKTYHRNARGEVTQLDYADSTHEYWDYDENGNCNYYKNGKGDEILYEYDDAGRQTKVDYPTGTDTTFGYDAGDRLTSMLDSHSTTSSTWTYNVGDQVTALATAEGSFSYTYDHQGRRASMSDTTGTTATTTFHYDSAGRLDLLTNPLGEDTAWEYETTMNRLSKQTFDTGAYDVYGYDTRGRLYTLTHKNSSGTTLSAESYGFDDASNMNVKIVDTNKTLYTYDDADQLTREKVYHKVGFVWSQTVGKDWSYSYDHNGNRATMSEAQWAHPDVYNVDNADKLTNITNNGNYVKRFTYNGDGSRHTQVDGTGTGTTTTYSYDYDARLTGITYPSSATNSFAYNGVDARTSMTNTSSVTTTFRRDGVDATDDVISDGANTFTPGISRNSGSSTTFAHADYLGTLNRETNSSQSTTGTRTYDAWGVQYGSSGSPGGHFGFAGQWGYQEDPDSSLKLLGHRYYDPSIGRFLTRDPARDGRNWNTYVDNEPSGSVDPTGLRRAPVHAPPPTHPPGQTATIIVRVHTGRLNATDKGCGHVWAIVMLPGKKPHTIELQPEGHLFGGNDLSVKLDKDKTLERPYDGERLYTFNPGKWTVSSIQADNWHILSNNCCDYISHVVLKLTGNGELIENGPAYPADFLQLINGLNEHW